MQHLPARPHRAQRCHRLHCRAGDILKFKGNDIHSSCKNFESVRIGVGGIHLDIADLTRWAICLWLVGVDSIAHAPGGHGQHAAELAATEYAYDAAWLDGFGFRQRRIRAT